MSVRRVTTERVVTNTPSRELRRDRQAIRAEAERLYETFGEPLEQEHWGKYLAVSPDGRTILGDDLEGVSQEAAETLGQGNFLFKVGEVDVGRIR